MKPIKEIYIVGDEAKCVDDSILSDAGIRPSVVLNKEYPVKGVTTDSEGNQHLDIGLESSIGFVRSLETGEELEDGDSIHWCHPSRFEKIIKQ